MFLSVTTCLSADSCSNPRSAALEASPLTTTPSMRCVVIDIMLMSLIHVLQIKPTTVQLTPHWEDYAVSSNVFGVSRLFLNIIKILIYFTHTGKFYLYISLSFHFAYQVKTYSYCLLYSQHFA
jgi:hypothetical protein